MTSVIDHYKQKHNTKIVLSLTTSPSRIQYIPYLLDVLNVHIFDNIYINIPKTFDRTPTLKYKIPKFSQKHVVINKIAHDLGPATKVLPILDKFKNNPNMIVVSIDDDIKISKNPDVLAKLVIQCIKSNCVITGIGKRLSDWNLSSNKISPSRKPYVDIIEGWTGVAYKPSMIDIDFCVKMINGSSYCKLSDDLVLSWGIRRRGFKIKSLMLSTSLFKELFWGLGNDAIHYGAGSKNPNKHIQAHYYNYAKCFKKLL